MIETLKILGMVFAMFMMVLTAVLISRGEA
jgi:hypothetical protein